ncbi:MAG: hypothetical protein ACRDG6_06370 [Candidatus Limnocylindria bacterium]
MGWIQFTTLSVDDDLVLDVRLSPRDALSRLERAINQRPRRVLGVLKVNPEYVGVTSPSKFEIWERRQHAVHAYGRIDRRQGGARVSASFVQSGRSWTLLVVFFVLYGLFGAGFVSRDAGPLGPALSSVVLVVGGMAIAVYFFLSARRQRADLRRFVTVVFAEVVDGGGDGSAPAKTPSASRHEEVQSHHGS